jgi:hypothetical protein
MNGLHLLILIIGAGVGVCAWTDWRYRQLNLDPLDLARCDECGRLIDGTAYTVVPSTDWPRPDLRYCTADCAIGRDW